MLAQSEVGFDTSLDTLDRPPLSRCYLQVHQADELVLCKHLDLPFIEQIVSLLNPLIVAFLVRVPLKRLAEGI